MAWAFHVIVSLCFALQTVQTLAPRWLPHDVAFSGDALERGSWWVWASASLLHGDWPHLCNNMLLLAGTGPQLEYALGGPCFLALFFGAGGAGWAASLCYGRLRHGEDMWHAAAKFSSTLGSSPCVYGAAFAAAVLMPSTTACCTLATSFGLRNWMWPTLLVLNMLVFRGRRYGLFLVGTSSDLLAAGTAGTGTRASGKANVRAKVCAESGHDARGLAAAGMCGIGCPVRPWRRWTPWAGAAAALVLASAGARAVQPLSAAGWLCAYVCFCEAYRLCDRHVLHRSVGSCDNIAHAGGITLGVAVGWAVRRWLHSADELKTDNETTKFAALTFCVGYFGWRAAKHGK